jgi:Tol biopolymer transport system component
VLEDADGERSTMPTTSQYDAFRRRWWVRLGTAVGLVVAITALPAPGAHGTPEFGDAATTAGRDGDIAYTRLPDDPDLDHLADFENEIWVTDPAGTGTARLVEGHGPVWSPDGSWLAFQSWVGEGGERTQIHVARADGSDERTLASGAAPSWAPDGQRLAFVERGLVVMGRDGTGTRRLTTARDHGPAWSPRGDRIAFERRLGGGGDAPSGAARDAIFTVAPDGTAVAQLTGHDARDPRQEQAPAWSPDGRQLVFISSRRDGQGCSWPAIVGTDGSDRRDLLGLPCGVESVAWAPKGGRLLVLSQPADGGCDTLSVVDADRAGGDAGRRDLGGLPCYIGGPVWSPDGRSIVLWGGERRGSDPFVTSTGIHVVGADGTGQRQVVRTEAWTPAWQPVASPPDPRIAAACPADEVEPAGFYDILGDTHRSSIDCIAWWGIATGQTPTWYGPAEPVSRGQVARLLAAAITRAGGDLSATPAPRFTDVTGTAFAREIHQLAAAGIVDGVTATTYAPRASISRAQMAKLLVNALEYVRGAPLPPPSADHFRDDDGTALEPYIDAAAEAGLTSGTAPGVFSPAAPVGRGQAASFLALMMSRLVEDGDVTPPA